MKDQQRLEKLLAGRSPAEVEHFLRRLEVVLMIATRRPRWFPSCGEGGWFGRARREQATTSAPVAETS